MSKPPSRGSTITRRATAVDQEPGHAQPPQNGPVAGPESFRVERLGLGGSRLTLHGWTLSPGSTAPTNSYRRWPRSRCSGRRPGRRAGDTGHDLVGSAVNVAAEQLVGPRVGSTIRDYSWCSRPTSPRASTKSTIKPCWTGCGGGSRTREVLGLVKAFLKAGVLTEDGLNRDTRTGTPPGGILSPLLANVALSALDEHFTWSGRGGRPRRCQLRPDARCYLGWSLNPPTPACVLGLGGPESPPATRGGGARLHPDAGPHHDRRDLDWLS